MIAAGNAGAQHGYFVDGYHGGVYGHYPKEYTAFINETLAKHPGWKISLEIEPETWDSVQRNEPANYASFRSYLADQSDRGRVEYVNPSYGQPYFYNINGESIIRQFAYGIRKMKQHFPELRYSTYSSEEPCFTSALPQVLVSFGFSYASLKNPNTCWGGYTRAHGGQLVNWVGPDGSKLLTVPRYGSEALDPKSTWQTTASTNSPAYINSALAAGIINPVGMCLQDAGWKNGPWLKGETSRRSTYTTWREYISGIAEKQKATDWKFSQEDIQVSLVWGAQVLQQIARQVRFSENSLGRAEKLAAVAKVWNNNASYPSANFDEAWRQLLLAQHHDCWIVPYNGRRNATWIDKVRAWTSSADSLAVVANSQSAQWLGNSSATGASTASASVGKTIQLFNPNAADYNGIIRIPVAEFSKAGFQLRDAKGKTIPCQYSNGQISFKVGIAGMGFACYDLVDAKSGNNPASIQGTLVSRQTNGQVQVETDLYRLVLNPAAGGAIVSLVAKKMGNREFVDRTKAAGLNLLEGYFFRDSAELRSSAIPAEITVLEDGPLAASIQVKGRIGIHPFTQLVKLTKTGEPIDVSLRIDWQGNPGIGDGYKQSGGYKAEDYRKAFYDDSNKLQTLFPVRLANQRIDKNAPFDVTESRLGNTVFQTWDSIKNNVILNWIDITDGKKEYGFAVFSDHTTSYLHHDGIAGLTTQYSGVGLWGRNYSITGPTEFRYAFFPHKGDWEKASLWKKNTEWNNPPVVLGNDAEASLKGEAGSRSITGPAATNNPSAVRVSGTTGQPFIRTSNQQIEITAVEMQGENLLVRLFNPSRKTAATDLALSFTASSVEAVELDGRVKKTYILSRENKIRTSLPAFGFQTFLFTGVKNK